MGTYLPVERRTFLRMGAAALAAASMGSGPAVTARGTPSDDEILAPIHPELQPAVREVLPLLKSLPPFDAASLAKLREPAPYDRQPLAAPAYAEYRIPVGKGAPDVRIYVINAPGRGATVHRPAILCMHGGGYVIGNAIGLVADLQELCLDLGCVAVSVDYRLAPETPFPGALEDNYAALKWLHDNADALGVDRNRIAVMGDSAGGGHAVMLAIAARDRGDVRIVHQSLSYPMLDDRTLPADVAEITRLMWGPESNRFGWTSFLGQPAGAPTMPKGSVPGRETDLRGLPPAFIGVGALDLFLDEDMRYARALIASGIAAELMVVPGAFHSFDYFQQAGISKRYRAARVAALRTAFAT